jgi:hypothetical protein
MPNLKDKPAQSSPIPSTYLIMLVDPVTGAVKKMSVAEFLSAEITADTLPPSIVSAYMLNSTKIRVIFSENVPNGAVAGWSSKKNGSANPIIALAGVGTATLDFTLTNAVVSGDTVLISYNPASGNTTDASANEVASITDRTVVNSLGGAGDITPPGITSMVVPNGSPTNVVVTFNENVPVLTTSGWSFKKLGVNWPISSVSQTSGNVWTFVMSTPAAAGNALLGSYNSASGNTTDGSGNELVTFTDVTVTNSVAGSYDSDAQAVFTAAGITDTDTMQNFSDMFAGFKTDSVFTKIRAGWYFCFGNATNSKFNFKNPVDSDGAHRALFNGTYTINGLGFQGDGTSGYVNLKFNPSVHLPTFFDSSILVYGRQDFTSNGTVAGGNRGTFGALDTGAARRFWLASAWAGAGVETLIGDNNPSTTPIRRTDGCFQMSRRGASDAELYINGVSQSNTTATQSSAAPNVDAYAGALNIDNTPSFHCDDRIAMIIIADGLTDTEADAMENRVNAFLTAEGLNVY